MKITQISRRIAHTISQELGHSEEKEEIIAYGIESTILAILGLVAVVLIALPFNALLPAVIATLFGGILRKLSGGAHFDNPFKCLVFGAIVYSILGVVSKQVVKYDLYNIYTFLAVLLISIAIITIIAPVDSEAKPIHSSVFKKKLKIASIGFVLLTCVLILISDNFLINTSVVMGIVYQTITLLPVFNKKKKEV